MTPCPTEDVRYLMSTLEVIFFDETYSVKEFRNPVRKSGRRFVIRNAAGVKVHDTEYCYDRANAMNSVNLWAEKVAREKTESQPKEEIATVRTKSCVHCGGEIYGNDHAQDAESGKPICKECVAKASQVSDITPVEEFEECPF